MKTKPIRKPRNKLTIKQTRFVDEIIKTGNATEAASKVYNTKNRRTAQTMWSHNLSNVIISAEIESRVNKCKNEMYRLAMSAEKDSDKIKALQDVIDRAEGKATIKIWWDDWLPFTVNIVKYG